MHSRYENERQKNPRDRELSPDRRYLALKALIYFAFGILCIDWVSRITMGH